MCGWLRTRKDKIYFDSYGLASSYRTGKIFKKPSVLQQRTNTARQRSVLWSFMFVRAEENMNDGRKFSRSCKRFVLINITYLKNKTCLLTNLVTRTLDLCRES